MRHGVRAALAALIVIVIGGLAVGWVCVTRIPEGSVGLRRDPSEEILTPGLHWHPPVRGPVVFPAGPRTFRGEARVLTAEGAARLVPWELSLDLAKARPEGAGSVGGRLAGGATIDEAVAIAVEEALPAGVDAAAARLAPLGLVPGSLRTQAHRLASEAVTGEAPAAEHPLKAGYAGPDAPVLLIGLDAADWDLMAPMMDRGQLPHMARLRERGAWGILRSMRPTLSPILWTTIVTGRPPAEHGILDFLVRDAATGQEVPISRLSRRVKSIWNIASDLQVPSTTVAWWATWPAERVLGAMVTDRVAYSLFDLPLEGSEAGAVYPPDLMADLGRLRVDAQDIEYEDVRSIVPIDAVRFEKARAALDTQDSFRDPVSHLIKVIASTKTYHQMARHLLTARRTPLTLVYYQGIDEVNHRFAHYLPPAMALVKDEDPAVRRAFAEAVPGFYWLQDRLVGELVEAAGPDALVMVVSDHGFANGDERPAYQPPDIEARPGLWHTLDGVFMAAGPGVRPGRLREPLELLDVMPTLLAALGLPRADDMPGRVADEIFSAAGGPAGRSGVRIASYDQAGAPLGAEPSPTGSTVDREMMARLEALGYIQSGGSSTPQSAGTATATYHVNAGQVFLQANELDRARAAFEEARKLAPHFDAPRLGLAQVEVMRGHPEAALPYIEETLRAGDPLPGLFVRAARVYVGAHREKQGMAFLGSLDLQGLRDASRWCAVGLLHESLKETGEALTFHRKALAIEPGLERSLQSVYRLMRQGDDLESLATLLKRGMQAQKQSTRTRSANWLALTREAQGRRAEAIDILSTAVKDAPSDLMTLINLGSMLVRENRPAEGLPWLERAYSERPTSHEVLVNLIVAHGKLGHLDRARAVYEEAERSARPGDPAAQRHNAMAFAAFLNDDLVLAGQQIEMSLQLDPKQSDALRLKAEIDRRRKG
ncbi:MAG: alkaline phosphatase family protein [Candidatus Polarisedimenticolia bacterium]